MKTIVVTDRNLDLAVVAADFLADSGLIDALINRASRAIAEAPLGPFVKNRLNPVLNSGHETTFFPFKSGIAALAIKDGNEHYTMQYAEDGVNFEIASVVSFTPTAAAPFTPDAFTNTGDGRGVTWGLCHFINAGTSGKQHSIIARFHVGGQGAAPCHSATIDFPS